MNEKTELEATTPEKQVQTFADDVVEKANMVAKGEMTVAEFVANCMEKIKNIEVAQDAPVLGGLGENSQNFPNLEDLKSEA